jgi:hypothetical protein
MKTLRSAEANGATARPKSHASTTTSPGVLSEVKARQSAKIRELGQALIDAGLRTLEAQAGALWPSAQHPMDHSQNVSQNLGALSSNH